MTYRKILISFMIAFMWHIKAKAQAILGKIETGKVSYYSSRFHGRKTSLGEIHKSTELTAAHRTYPFNTMLEVTNPETNEKVVVRVNDRGPYSKTRLIDISKEAAKVLGIIAKGVATLSVRVVGTEGMVLLGTDEQINRQSGEIVPIAIKQ